MAVIGCDIPVRHVVGAEQIASSRAGLWTKTHFYQEGNYLCAKTFLVAAGEPSVLEFRIDLRPLEKVAARVHQRLHEKMVSASGREPGAGSREPAVGFSFSKAFKSIKNTAKKIGKSKLVKAVGGAIKTVAQSKLVGTLATGLSIAVPVVGLPALAAYGAAHAAVKAVNRGKKLTATAETARKALSTGASLSQKLAQAKAQAPARVAASAQNAQAIAKSQAAALATRAQAQASAQASVAAANAVKAAAAAKAKALLAAGQAQASATGKAIVNQVKAAEAKVAPAVAAAKTIAQKLSDPAVRAQLTTIKAQADSANKTLAEIKDKAKNATGAEKLDAQKSAAIVNLVAKNDARIQAMSQVNAGGLPSLLIDARGRIIPGKYKVVAKTAPKGKHRDVLYKGPKEQAEQGSFSKIAGGADLVGAVQKPWTIELWQSGQWRPQYNHGAKFSTHAEASKAITWYHKRGYRAQVAPYPRVKSQPKTRIGAATSPFPPPSPSEKRARDHAYIEWLKQHAPRRHGGSRLPATGQNRVGWRSPPPAWGGNTPDVGWSPPPAWGAAPVTIGCPCSDQGTLF